MKFEEAEIRRQLTRRINQKVSLEVAGDVAAIYELTLPQIREERIAERDDEPGLSLSGIEAYVTKISSAEVISVDIEKIHEQAPLYSDLPAALVVSIVRYNGSDVDSQSRTVWVLVDETWFTTSIGSRFS